MARIVEGLITGLGFIGGAILRLKDSVRGTATAASLWVTGAIGTSVGLGSYHVAVMLTAITVVTLWLLPPFKKLADNLDDPDLSAGTERPAREQALLRGKATLVASRGR